MKSLSIITFRILFLKWNDKHNNFMKHFCLWPASENRDFQIKTKNENKILASYSYTLPRCNKLDCWCFCFPNFHFLLFWKERNSIQCHHFFLWEYCVQNFNRLFQCELCSTHNLNQQPGKCHCGTFGRHIRQSRPSKPPIVPSPMPDQPSEEVLLNWSSTRSHGYTLFPLTQ